MPAAAIYSLSDSDDPLKDMLQKIGDLSKFKLNGARVLLWTYIRPRVTKGGILLTDKEVNEDVWQGVVGYVLALGPIAFKTDGTNDFGGLSVKPGDWVTFVSGEPRRVQINGVDCRITEDTQIQMVIPSPDYITHN